MTLFNSKPLRAAILALTLGAGALTALPAEAASFNIQFGGGGFFADERVGAPFKHSAIHDFRCQRTAQPCTRFVKRILDRLTGRACFLQLIGRSQPGDTAANDCYSHSGPPGESGSPRVHLKEGRTSSILLGKQ